MLDKFLALLERFVVAHELIAANSAKTTLIEKVGDVVRAEETVAEPEQKAPAKRTRTPKPKAAPEPEPEQEEEEEAPGEDWSLAEKVATQEELLGVSLIAHPLELAAEKITASGAISTLEASARIGQRVRVAGTRMTWRRTPTTRGDYIYFMALEDLEGMLDVVIFADVYRAARLSFSKPGPYIVEGTMELTAEATEPTLRAEKIWQVE